MGGEGGIRAHYVTLGRRHRLKVQVQVWAEIWAGKNGVSARAEAGDVHSGRIA